MLGAAHHIAHIIPDHDAQLQLDYRSADTITYSQVVEELCHIIGTYRQDFTIHALGYSAGGRLLLSAAEHIDHQLSSITFISSGLSIGGHCNINKKKQRLMQLLFNKALNFHPMRLLIGGITFPFIKGLDNRQRIRHSSGSLLKNLKPNGFKIGSNH